MTDTDYTTRNLTKAIKLFEALTLAGYQTGMISCTGHVHIRTAANAEQFAIIRATIGIPSSLDAEVAMVEIPNDISEITDPNL